MCRKYSIFMDENLIAKIESILFVAAEPLSFKKLSEILGVDIKTTKLSLEEFAQSLQSQQRGVRVLEHEGEVQLVSAPKYAPFIERLVQAIKNESLTQAAREVIAIVGYLGPVQKHMIDEIRGVDCSAILKNLLLKGIIDRREDPHDHRTHIYSLHANALRHLGIGHQRELPEFNDVRQQLDKVLAFAQSKNQEEQSLQSQEGSEEGSTEQPQKKELVGGIEELSEVSIPDNPGEGVS